MRRPLFVLLAVIAGAGCDNREAFEEPNPSLARMLAQRRADPYEASLAFADGKVMREPPSGTVPRDGTSAPPPITRELLALGRERFEVLCAACHGIGGDGQSMVAEKMDLRRPPSLEEARYRSLSREELFARISDGYGMMPSYAAMLDARERWAVASYLRALQLSRRVRLSELPPTIQAGLVRDMAEEEPR